MNNTIKGKKGFQKGIPSWSKDKILGKQPKHSLEHCKKISIAKKGKKLPPFTEEHKKKIGDSQRGIKRKPLSKEQKKKLSIAGKGRIVSDETRKKQSEASSGEKHWNWQDGLSNNPYPKEFNTKLKLKIRQRDNFTCCLCGKTEREELEELNRVLCVNHIDFNKDNCKEENLNTLCLRCNVKINRNRDYWTNYFNK